VRSPIHGAVGVHRAVTAVGRRSPVQAAVRGLVRGRLRAAGRDVHRCGPGRLRDRARSIALWFSGWSAARVRPPRIAGRRSPLRLGDPVRQRAMYRHRSGTDARGSHSGGGHLRSVRTARGDRSVVRRRGLRPRFATSKECIPLGLLGQPCTGEGAAGCITPFYCAGSPPTCQAPGPAGTSCSDPAAGNAACSSGLICAPDGECELTFVGAPGDPCDGVIHRCLRGSCPHSAITGGPVSGVCPTIIADGMPCSAMDTCDADSECVNPTAKIGATTGVCRSRSTVICP
jgi:hypothetical protein